jgi:hypothetical protein
VGRNRAKEKFSGFGGAVLMAPWVFQGALRVWDWAGRAQTAMTVAPHLGILSTPLAFLIEFVGVAGLLFHATRLEHQREADETPRIIRAWSEPEKPKRHWFWIKVAIGVVFVSIIAACITAYWIEIKVPIDEALVRSAIRYPIPPVAKAITSHALTKQTKEVASVKHQSMSRNDVVGLIRAIQGWSDHNQPTTGSVPLSYSPSQESEFHHLFEAKIDSVAYMLRSSGFQEQASRLQARQAEELMTNYAITDIASLLSQWFVN